MTARRASPPRRPRRWRRPLLGIALVALAAAGGAAVWSARSELLVWALHRALDGYGLSQAQFTLDRLDAHRLVLHDVRLRGGAVEAAALTAVYSPLALAAAHLERLEITGLRLTATVADGRLLVGGQPLEPGRSAAGGGIAALKLADARLTVDDHGNRYTATLEGEGALAAGHLRATAIHADVTAWVNKARYDLRVTAPKVDLAFLDNGVTADFAEAGLSLANPSWSADGVRGSATWHPGQAGVEIGSLRLSQRETSPIVQPIQVSGRATMAGPAVDYALHLAIASAAGTGTMAFDVKGRHDLSSGNGSANVVMPAVTFAPDGVQPHDFFPRWTPALGRFGGRVALSGPVRWKGARLSSDILVHLTGGTLESDTARITHAEGDVRLVDLLPLATPPGQALAGIVDFDALPPIKADLRFQIMPDATLAVETASFAFAHGRIVTAPFAIKPAETTIETVLDVQQLDLSELLQLVGVEGLGGTGRLDGHIPLKLAGGHARISDAALAASGPGVLSFKRDRLPPEITGAGESMTLVLRVLEDFHYDTLSLHLTEGEAGQGTVLLVLHGANPAVLDGQRFNFNIKLESDFDRLTDLALRGMAATRELLRQAERSLQP